MRVRLALLALLAGCGSPSQQQTGLIPPGTPSRSFDADGDGTADGVQYDLDGDGNFDAVDIDGDGLLDGGDFDGDGVVTVFAKLGTGAIPPTQAQLDSFPEDVDPDFEAALEGIKADGVPQVMTMPSVDLSNFLPRPVSQGALGSCAAFANAAVATAFRAQREQLDPNTVWASQQFLYARQLKASGGTCDNGTFIHDGLATLVAEGATPLAKLPYSDKMCSMDPEAVDANLYRIGTFEFIKPMTRDKIKEHLSKGTPIVFGVTLPPNFGRFGGAQGKGVFKSETGQLGGKHGGGHAMVLAGYDDAKGAYRVLNSWGTDWGDGGYAWWDYADLEGRDGLMGIAVGSYSGLPPVAATLTEPQLTVEAKGAIAVRTGSGDRLIAATFANGPIIILGVKLDDQEFDNRLQFLAFGNITAKSTSPLAAGAHKLTIAGRIASGMTVKQAAESGAMFERTLMVTVGDPVMDPDGRL